MKNVLSGSFTSTGQTATIPVLYGYNVSLVWGTATGNVDVERSFDSGVTWRVVKKMTNADAVPEYVGNEPEVGVLYRLNCTTKGGTGNIGYRMGCSGLAS